MTRSHLFLSVVAAGFLLVSCTTMADYDYSAINHSLATGSYQTAYQKVEEDHRRIYSPQDQVLLNLDKGLLSHYAGEYQRSNSELAAAEQKIYEYYTKSITQAISSYLINDTVVDYAGEVFEDIYTNIFMALNYIQLGDTEGAFVEIRRFDNKLQAAAAKYSDMIVQANQESNANGGTVLDVPEMEFHNSALARYISMLLYRSGGQLDAAAVDMQYLISAFASQPHIYNFERPSSLAHELEIPSGKARLNLVAFSGRAPIKREEEVRLFSYLGEFYYKIAFPQMERLPSAISAIHVELLPAGTSSASQPQEPAYLRLEPLESISNIALDTFAQRQALIYLRATIRSIVKASSTAVWDGLSEASEDSSLSLLFLSMKLASSLATEMTERADVRTSRYFPSLAWVGGITVEPGDYIVNVKYLDSAGSMVSKEQHLLSARANNLNLVESICLR